MRQKIWILADRLEREWIVETLMQEPRVDQFEVVELNCELQFIEQLHKTTEAPVFFITALRVRYMLPVDTLKKGVTIPEQVEVDGSISAGVRCTNALRQKFPETVVGIFHNDSDGYRDMLFRSLESHVVEVEIFESQWISPLLLEAINKKVL